jgi:D-serine deaminase-like pyridoxal phosphate-dependent protein
MSRTGNKRTLDRDPCLVRTSIPEYSLVGFVCATAAENAVTLTLGLVTGPPYPESRPIRVRMSRDDCRELAVALDRVEQMVGMAR